MNGYMFQIWDFGSQKSSRGFRTTYKNPLKTIYTEFSLDIFEVIGIVGGTLGLMVGFSFIGFVNSITNSILLLVSKWNNAKIMLLQRRAAPKKAVPSLKEVATKMLKVETNPPTTKKASENQREINSFTG